jgi:aminopeptidase N
LVNIDADKVLLALKVDNKTPAEFAYQYFNGPLYLDRHEALEALAPHQDNEGARKVLIAALQDKYAPLQIEAIQGLNLNNADVRNAALPVLATVAQSSKNTLVQAAALNVLAKQKSQGYYNLFKQAIGSESYAVQAAALNGIYQINPAEGLTYANKLKTDSEGPLKLRVVYILAASGEDKEWPFVYDQFKTSRRAERIELIENFATMTAHVKLPAYAQQGITELLKTGKMVRNAGFASVISEYLNNIRDARLKMGDDASAKAAEDAIKGLK